LITGGIGLNASAQVSVNIGSQPLWGPVGYNHVDYYYLPDVGAYYSVPKRQFVYLDGPTWVFSNALPTRYSSYDLYHGYKVVLNEPTPYLHDARYHSKYAHYRGNKGQPFIRDSKEEKYFKIKGHPQYGKAKNDKGNNGGGNGKGNGKSGGNNGKKNH
jgi:hypothetical protein